ncbi:MAG TPA: ABC transporter ATP-binding protein [Trebonia sp.]
MQAAIEAHSVSQRTRAGEPAVRDISLTVGRGELVGITGTSGSGQTMLLDAMSGLRPPLSGTVIRYPAGDPGSGGYVPADSGAYPALPLERALRYTAALRSVPGGERAVPDALATAGLTGRAAVPGGELSAGERKRAAVAAELLACPAQLFLEEPTAGLDPGEAAEVLRLLRRLAGDGITVVLTTGSPLDAARCDKVAVLATGGHLAFFGTPAAAREYFGADSLEEIYERLAGLSDPATAWSRRFYHFSPPRPGFAPVPVTSPRSGPRFLVPESAGPHSAGRVSVFPGDPRPTGLDRADPWPDRRPVRPGPVRPSPVRQLPVLSQRNAEVLRRSPAARLAVAAAPVAVLLAFAALIGAGALNSPGAAAAWIVLGGLGTGLAYGLPPTRGEPGILRAERFAGLSAAAYLLARLAVALPGLAVADAIALLVPAAGGRLPDGYGPAYLTLLLASAVALALALLLSAVTAVRGRRAPVSPALWLPAVLLAGAALTLLDHPSGVDWLSLAALAVVFAAAAAVFVGRLPAGRPERTEPIP